MSERKPKLYLSILGKENAIGIGKEVIKALGVPQYITFKVKDNNGSIIIVECEKEDVMSFKVPERFLNPDGQKNFRLHSKMYVEALLKSLGLAIDKSHYYSGIYSSENNAVVFKLREAEGGTTDV